MHRLMVDSCSLESGVPALSREAERHLKVIRLKEGELLELFDGAGAARMCRREGGSLVFASPVKRFPRPHQLTLFACITKGARWDWTIEKATELGVGRIVPVVSDRTIVRISRDERAAKRERWLKIAQEAARQSDAKWVPEVLLPVDFGDSIEMVRENVCFVGALTDPMPKPIGAVLGSVSDGDLKNGVSVYVGPEGDFTPEELKALLDVALPASFGSTILRAETAAIYAISAVKARLDTIGD